MFLAKSYCDIGNSRSSSSIVVPDGEITTTFEYDDHIGASIKDLGKKWFGFSKMEILTPDEWWKGSIESNQYAIFQEYKY